MINTLRPMNREEYAAHWQKESSLFETNKIYEKLSNITPIANTIEVGCGAGYSTYHLAKSRTVLVIENNNSCIDFMKCYFEKNNQNIPEIIYSDILNLSTADIKLIHAFSPKVIVAWFIGSCPEDVYTHVSEDVDFNQKFKKYRENIEDILLNDEIFTGNVEWIHLASRGNIADSISYKDVIEGINEDYSVHVFNPNGFRIESIDILDWERVNSDFNYIVANNPNFIGGESSPKIISILAKRVKK